MTSVANNRDRGIDIEDESCRQWPFEPAAEDRGNWYDLAATDSFDVTGQSVGAGDYVECKSCWNHYGSRRGRWWIPHKNHDRLVESDGWYTLSIVDRDTGYILRMSLVRAAHIDQLISGRWADCGRGGKGVDQYRQLPWSAVFDPAETPGGGQA
jgi:hypothetical protein